MRERRLDDLLINSGALDEGQLSEAQDEARLRGRRLSEAVIDLGFIDERGFANLVAQSAGLPLVAPLSEQELHDLSRRLPTHLARQYQVVPVAQDEDQLTIAVIDPFEEGVIDEMQATTHFRIGLAVGIRSEVESAVLDLYGSDEEVEITLLSGKSLSIALETDLEAGTEGDSAEPVNGNAPIQRVIASTQTSRSDEQNRTLMVKPTPQVVESETGNASTQSEIQSPETSHPDEQNRTLMVKPVEQVDGTSETEQTRPTPIRTRSNTARLDHIESQIVGLFRVLALIQTKLESIEGLLVQLSHRSGTDDENSS